VGFRRCNIRHVPSDGPPGSRRDASRGARVPGTSYELDPVHAAFNIGAMVRWLDFNEPGWRRNGVIPQTTWGGYCGGGFSQPPRGHEAASRCWCFRRGSGHDKAHESRACWRLENSFIAWTGSCAAGAGASTAVVTQMLGGTRDGINAVSNAWIDGGALRTYRHAPNTARVRAGRPAMPPAGRCATL